MSTAKPAPKKVRTFRLTVYEWNEVKKYIVHMRENNRAYAQHIEKMRQPITKPNGRIGP